MVGSRLVFEEVLNFSSFLRFFFCVFFVEEHFADLFWVKFINVDSGFLIFSGSFFNLDVLFDVFELSGVLDFLVI
jgi:hypothetical protein